MVEAVLARHLSRIRAVQRAEITECEIYRRLARRMKDGGNREILERIAGDERRHHDFWERLTGSGERPSRLRVWLYTALARTLGLTFALKLMERGEDFAQAEYEQLREIPGVPEIIEDEEAHERQLIDLLDDERLEYASSVVLGLNDALVELTGALAGFTLAFANAHIVAAAGLVTGVAASLSMAASEYLSSKADTEAGRGGGKSPVKAAVYTGIAYIGAVTALILPYLLMDRALAALPVTLGVAAAIIAGFNAYISVARDLRFWPRFAEMTLISFGVAAVSFGLGWAVRAVWGIEL